MFYVEQILKNGITVSNIKYVMACGILLDFAMLLFREVQILFIFLSALYTQMCFLALHQQCVIKLFGLCQYDKYKTVNQCSSPFYFHLLQRVVQRGPVSPSPYFPSGETLHDYI
jgi:hypothetical protein